jgi:sulfate transport system substrate-binding protein
VAFSGQILDYDCLFSQYELIMPNKFASLKLAAQPRRWFLAAAALALSMAPALAAEPALLNVSYDVMRELFKEINPAFVAE